MMRQSVLSCAATDFVDDVVSGLTAVEVLLVVEEVMEVDGEAGGGTLRRDVVVNGAESSEGLYRNICDVRRSFEQVPKAAALGCIPFESDIGRTAMPLGIIADDACCKMGGARG